MPCPPLWVVLVSRSLPRRSSRRWRLSSGGHGIWITSLSNEILKEHSVNRHCARIQRGLQPHRKSVCGARIAPYDLRPKVPIQHPIIDSLVQVHRLDLLALVQAGSTADFPEWTLSAESAYSENRRCGGATGGLPVFLTAGQYPHWPSDVAMRNS